MARRRRFHGTRAAAPKLIITKVPKLDVAGLATAYEWCAVDKTFGLNMAFGWYKQNAVALLHGDVMDADRMKSYDRARKAQELSESSTYEGEKVQAGATAIHLLEKVFAGKNLPTVDAALTAPATKRMEAVQRTLAALNAAFAEYVTWTVRPGITDREFGGRNIHLPQTQIEALATLAPLRAVLQEVPLVAQVASLVNGELDGQLFMENLPKILHGVYVWAETAGDLVKSPGKFAAKTGAVKTPKAPGAKVPDAMRAALEIMRAPGGATVAEISAATGWNGDSVRWYISQKMKKGMGLAVVKTGDRYSIV